MSVGLMVVGLWLSPAASSETTARTPVTSKNAEPQLCTLGSGPMDGHPWDCWNAALIARRGAGRVVRGVDLLAVSVPPERLLPAVVTV